MKVQCKTYNLTSLTFGKWYDVLKTDHIDIGGWGEKHCYKVKNNNGYIIWVQCNKFNKKSFEETRDDIIKKESMKNIDYSYEYMAEWSNDKLIENIDTLKITLAEELKKKDSMKNKILSLQKEIKKLI